MPEPLGEAYVELTARTEKLKHAFRKAEGFTQESTARMTGFAKKAGAIIGAYLGIRTAIGAGRAISDFGTALAEVMTISEDAEAQFDRMKKSLLTISRTVGVDVADATRALYQTISAGITDLDEALKVVKTSSRLAVGSLVPAETAVSVLTAALKAYRIESSRAEEVSDLLFQTVRLGRLRMGELSAALGKVAPVAAEAGISLEELLATFAALTLSGQDLDIASTSLRGTIMAILKPQKDAVEMAKKLGIEWNVAGVQAKGFAGFLADVTERTQGNQNALIALVPNVRALTGAMQLVSDGGERYNRVLNQMGKAAGASSRAHEIMAKTLAHSWEVIKASLFVMAEKILGGPLAKLADFLHHLPHRVETFWVTMRLKLTELARSREWFVLVDWWEKFFKPAAIDAWNAITKAWQNFVAEVTGSEWWQTAAGWWGIFEDKGVKAWGAISKAYTNFLASGAVEWETFKTKMLKDLAEIAQRIGAEYERINKAIDRWIDRQRTLPTRPEHREVGEAARKGKDKLGEMWDIMLRRKPATNIGFAPIWAKWDFSGMAPEEKAAYYNTLAKRINPQRLPRTGIAVDPVTKMLKEQQETNRHLSAIEKEVGAVPH